jgi:adenylosuccinate lyase
VIEKHIKEELPFMATEVILMEGVKRGGDRQELHEKVRVLSMEAAREVKEHGRTNDLIERIIKDGTFNMTEEELYELLEPENFIGCAAMQVTDFVADIIDPLLQINKDILGIEGNVRV